MTVGYFLGKRSNLSRTLNTMAQYGIVELVRKNKAVKPVVKATSFQVEFELGNRSVA
jgi:predicted transcriptional regulator